MHFHHFALHLNADQWTHLGRLGRKLIHLFADQWTRVSR